MNPKGLTQLSALIAGLVFGLGLILAGMANPAKVLAFLDITGTWDPSLALVMVGAIAVAIFAFAWAKSQSTSLLKQPIKLPDTQTVDKKLIIGASLFGIGWGMAGICPGPAVVLLGMLSMEGVYFFIAMLAGMAIVQYAQK